MSRWMDGWMDGCMHGYDLLAGLFTYLPTHLPTYLPTYLQVPLWGYMWRREMSKEGKALLLTTMASETEYLGFMKRFDADEMQEVGR